MKFMCIASGSSGNCIYIGSEGTNLLLDAGVSCKNIVSGLKSINVNPESIDAILVTHEHIDHIRGIDVFEKNYKAKVYSTNETLESIKGKYISRDIFMPVTPGREFNIGSIEITPFSSSHDAANPVCYTFKAGGCKISTVTDLGTFDSTTVSMMQDSELLYVEANHDENMLMVGVYPYNLKMRILGDRGHLSNETSARLISKVLNRNLKNIFLGHLSKENNYPELAYLTAFNMLKNEWHYDTPMPKLAVANRGEPSELINL
jgi:phosphoribosyl 1,2-cyclic phosphodiesterase